MKANLTMPTLTEDDLVGIHEGLSSHEYHGGPGISFTGYKQFMKSALHFKAYLERGSELTPSRLLGQLTHCMSLEPEETEKRFKRIGERATPKLKEECAALGLTAVNDTTWAKAEAMSAAVMKHEEAAWLITTGKAEVSGFWKDPGTGVLRKCRPDVWHQETEVICDLKYIDDASEEGFERQCVRMKYHLQSAWYLEGWSILTGKQIRRHVHICVEDEYPNAVQLHALSDHDLEASRESIRKRLGLYAKCLKEDRWPGYPAGVRTAVLPPYAYQITEEGEVV